MFNPITFVRDVIYILKNPHGKPIEASVITEDTLRDLGQDVEDLPQDARRHFGDYLLRFESDMFTIVPKKEFFKYYAFTSGEDPSGKTLMPVIQIKPL